MQWSSHSFLITSSFVFICRELETASNRPVPTLSHPLGNSLYLNTDTGQDSFSLYSSLVSSYKWWNKTHDYASGAVQLLAQNGLSRSKESTVQRQRRRMGGGNKAYFAQPQQLDQLINQVSNTYQDMRYVFVIFSWCQCTPFPYLENYQKAILCVFWQNCLQLLKRMYEYEGKKLYE